MTDSIIVRDLGLQPYQPVVDQMRQFTDSRTEETPDELWVLQHCPVYTVGQAGDYSHVLDAGEIEVLQTDRGGQVTYHGPGQLVVYTLINLRRHSLGVRGMVELLENTVIELLASWGIDSTNRRHAPGVYVGERKIAALGLRVRRGCTFHGLALNVLMDLEPYNRINPCGYEGLAVTQVTDLCATVTVEQSASELSALLIDKLRR